MSGIIYKINKILEAKNLKKQAFADKIGVSRDTVYNWTDDNIKVSTLVKVSGVLGVSMDYFLSNDKNAVAEPAADYGKKENSGDKYRKNLKAICLAVGITKNVTSHTGRKTFAMIKLNYEGYGIAGVSKMLGHGSIKTTETYYAKVELTLVSRELDRLGI